MSYQILPNIIFILAILGMLMIIMRRLPETAQDAPAAPQDARQKLAAKGLPVAAMSKVRAWLGLRIKKIWNFMLEAKDLKPHSAMGYRMKQIFGGKLPGIKAASGAQAAARAEENEEYYLDNIKRNPKNFSNYDFLGKFYISQNNFSEARDVYLYLAGHQPASADFQARLAFCQYQLKNFRGAAEGYKKSLALDSTQPNRYYNLGLSWEAAGDPVQAVLAIKKALELEPENPKYLRALQKLQKPGSA